MRNRLTGLFAQVSCTFLLTGVTLGSDIYVAVDGNDANAGTQEKPFGTLSRAQQAIREQKSVGATVWLRGGIYYLTAPLVFTAEDSGSSNAPAVYSAMPGEKVIISGGRKLELEWKPYKEGIMQAQMPAGFTTDQLFVNGKLQPMARYPNFDPKMRIFNGYSAQAIAPERVKRWADPKGGFIHTQHHARWGSYHYQITGKDSEGKLLYEGGWQHNYKSAMHDEYRMVENIFEELDSPGEWFLNKNTGTLYYFQPEGVDMSKAIVEGVRLTQLVEFKGTPERPVRWIALKGLTFQHAARTFMETKEPLTKSDWCIGRFGAIFVEGTEDCHIEDCVVTHVGSNAIFANMYNRRFMVRGCHIKEAGASGVCFVGGAKALRPRSKLGNYDAMEKQPGPASPDYPAECVIEDSLIHDIGRVEKQVAGVEIDIAQGIVVRHCSIYDVPRGGIIIGSGSFSGHLIEFCDVFDTVMETHDHGCFNSWGRDRYWHKKPVVNTFVAKYPELPYLDALTPTIIRNSRWRCDDGWDIDLDDGSTRYEIRNNLCLAGGIKRADGYQRVIENNIMVNGSLSIHKWYYGNMQDVIRYNIVFKPYKLSMIEPQVPGFQGVDYTLFHKPGVNPSRPSVELQKQLGMDQHSIEGDAQFIDPANGDFRVKEGSPALALGFKNFSMNQFGVQKPELKKIARTPVFPERPQPKKEKDARD